LTGRSALTAELVRLPSRVQRVLTVRPVVIAVLDVVITVSRTITDDDDERPLGDRLAALFDENYAQFPNDADDPHTGEFLIDLGEKITAFVAESDAKDKLERLVKRGISRAVPI
jgi:hypothetical protein